MTSPGTMVKFVADVLGVPEVTVLQHDRNLAAAGLRTKGGRGRSAAKMTPQDIANLLIGVAASSMVKETVEIVGDYSALPVHSTFGQKPIYGKWDLLLTPIPVLKALPPKHTLGQALTGLIQAASDGSLKEAIKSIPRGKQGRFIEVTFHGPIPGAFIKIGAENTKESMYYSNTPEIGRDTSKQWEEIHAKYSNGDLTQMREFSIRTIFAVGEMLKN